MYARTVLLSIAAGGLLLSQAGSASAAQGGRFAASFVGSAQGQPTAAETCNAGGTQPADFKCPFDTVTYFHNAQVHGIGSGVLHVDRTNAGQTGCAAVTGILHDKIYSNSGHFLGGLTEQIQPGSKSCLSRVDGIQTQELTSTIVGGTYHQRGNVLTHSVTIRPVNPNEPALVAGTFESPPPPVTP